MEPEWKQRVVVYWPGVVLVGLIAVCSAFSFAFVIIMLTVVEIPAAPGDAYQAALPCGSVREMIFEPDPVDDSELGGEGQEIDFTARAACRAKFDTYVPSVVTAGTGPLGLFLTSAVMLTVQVRRRGFSEISHRPEPSYASPEY